MNFAIYGLPLQEKIFGSVRSNMNWYYEQYRLRYEKFVYERKISSWKN